MKIVFISHLTNVIAQGPNYSVPAQVASVSRIDDVFWWNRTDAYQDFWGESGLFHGPDASSDGHITGLPAPFNRPDLVVFEDFYYVDDAFEARCCEKIGVPYVIVPRGALTKKAQSQKAAKKIIGNALMFSRMTRKAAGVQYLTEKEMNESGSKWCQSCFVIPNGVSNPKDIVPKQTGELNGVFIGRFAPWHKGLDLLLEACLQVRQELSEANLTISLYGPERNGCKQDYQQRVHDAHLENILLVKDGIFGAEKDCVLRQADFFIAPSRFEGMPMSVIEAAGYALPCLVSVGTNIGEDIDRFDAGWVCEAEVDSIAKSLLNLIADRESFALKGEGARKYARTLDWNDLAIRFHENVAALIS